MSSSHPSIVLYRWVLRSFRPLPKDCRWYYLKMARSHMNGHLHDVEPYKLEALYTKAQGQVEFVVKKYCGRDAVLPPFPEEILAAVVE